MIKKIFNIIIALSFIFWLYAIISDYIRVKNDEKAIFCYEQVIYDYEDGSVEECKGILYKVYYYNRPSLGVKTDFGPFWMEMRK